MTGFASVQPLVIGGVLASAGVAAFAVAMAEVLAVVALSPELDHWWLLPLRRLRARISHPLAGRPHDVPLMASVQQLHHSDAWHSVSPMITSGLLDTWEEGSWRILSYTVRGAVTATAV